MKAGATACYAWNKLYKTNLIKDNGFEFEKGVSLIEDILFNSKALSAAQTILFIPFIGTHYVQRKRVTLGNKYYSNCLSLLTKSAEAVGILLRAYGASDAAVQSWLRLKQYRNLQHACRNICSATNMNTETKKKEMKELLLTDLSRSILTESKSEMRGWKNQLFWLLMKYSFVTSILMIEGIRTKL